MAMNTQSINHHHYSPPIEREELQAPVSTEYGLRYTYNNGARMICTSSFMICPRNPQRHKPKHGLLRRSFTRVRSAQTRPEGRGVESSYPLFRLCLGSRGECLI
jgi:hypothetical protein